MMALGVVRAQLDIAIEVVDRTGVIAELRTGLAAAEPGARLVGMVGQDLVELGQGPRRVPPAQERPRPAQGRLGPGREVRPASLRLGSESRLRLGLRDRLQGD